MPRKNCNARLRERGKKIKAQPNFRIEVDIPSRPWRLINDFRPGVIVAEARIENSTLKLDKVV
ncbi:hypothetical protein DCMF_04500 [Candidatus Formimonas warabiya]|uniref:Uncharacterized protein n=1 Tax=Formimonas warabiya TaxID=1761012 RepID=A0A3G1KNV1_FORW1|nr:hypothetical protein DCMF_04500 [Candidatus Formimonas warabiya]